MPVKEGLGMKKSIFSNSQNRFKESEGFVC